MRYRDAGVDLTRSDVLKSGIATAARSTWTPGVRRLEGGFAGVMEWPALEGAPRLVAATMDGVGTKLHLAVAARRVADAAADLVYHGANDLLVHGARPLALLDYVAQSQLDPEVVAAVIDGLARACREVGAVLLGGETAEMPDTYLPGVVDVAACMIGTVPPERLLDGKCVAPGDAVLGLASEGLHTNGFSLARRVLARAGSRLSDPLPEDGRTLGDALLARHRWYGPALIPVLERGAVRALAHVTGGGIAGNLTRVLPEGTRARIDPRAWERPALFRWLQRAGEIPDDDARASFNLGIGMVVVCAADAAGEVSDALARSGERVFAIGSIVTGTRGVDWIDR
jgi:phosphoribosylformylglycinamidine cyclo-ligase